jgi:hypothetical protein
MEDRLSSEELGAILEAREQKQHAAEERGAKQLVEILTRPQSGMSRKYTFDMLADADDRPPAA